MNKSQFSHINALEQMLRAACLEVFPDMALTVETVSDVSQTERRWYVQTFEATPQLEILAALESETAENLAASSGQLSPILAAFAKALGKRAAKKMVPLDLRESASAPNASALGFRVSFGGTGPLNVLAAFPEAALEWLAADLQPAGPSRYGTVLDTLMDVELPVRILLGTKEMPLSEVMALRAGAVVDFDTPLGEPVEVIINGRTVAKGQVVLIDGNYGVRVSEVSAEGTSVANA